MLSYCYIPVYIDFLLLMCYNKNMWENKIHGQYERELSKHWPLPTPNKTTMKNIILLAIGLPLLLIFLIPLNFIIGYCWGWIFEHIPYVGDGFIYGIAVILQTLHISDIQTAVDNLTENLGIVFGCLSVFASIFKPSCQKSS